VKEGENLQEKNINKCMAALQENENGVLTTLTDFFATHGYEKKVQELYLKPANGVVKLQIDFFPGRGKVDSTGTLVPSKQFDRYSRMGRPLSQNNILVIKNVEVQTKGQNLVELAAVALLNDSHIDIIILEDILDPAWKARLLSGKDGRRKWLPSPVTGQDNVYLTKEQVQSDFLGGKSKRKRKRYSKKRKSRRK